MQINLEELKAEYSAATNDDASADCRQSAADEIVAAFPDLARTIESLQPSFNQALPNPPGATIEYWWFKGTSLEENEIPEPQVVLVQWHKSAVYAFYFAGARRKVHEMRGMWAGPIAVPQSK